ncbi:LAMI_0C05908g1_1 [Lachancea mirantina]|uniref:LAMI_0C05908g1_1 n=1 Tax=Lachancea mirantina TaxID=1230905 RepID=A0A1G4J327_9SACH|nr:LAMI_0C05908g1_1 [Lachancea mirantina]
MYGFRMIRGLSSTARLTSKSVSGRIIVPPATHFTQQTDSTPISSLKGEYKQLPEDSNYIEKFYNELERFSTDVLHGQLKKTYTDFDDNPDDLVFELEKYIELQVIPQHSSYVEKTADFSASRPLSTIHCKSVGDKLAIDRFLDFCSGVKLTLRLNGGHSFIFDVLLQAKSSFDEFEKKKG